MNALRFHRDLYSGEAIDAAAQEFAELARFELRVDGDHWVVELSGAEPDREHEIAGEFSNYALGLTIAERCQ